MVRVQMKFGGFLLTPVSPTRTTVCVLFNFDPKLASIPYWLLNFMSEKFCMFLLKFMRTAVKKVSDPKSDFAKRIRDNKLVYDEIKRRILMYIGMDTARNLGMSV